MNTFEETGTYDQMQLVVDHQSASTTPKYTPEYFAKILNIDVATLCQSIKRNVLGASEGETKYCFTGNIDKIRNAALLSYISMAKGKLRKELDSWSEHLVWSSGLAITRSDDVDRGTASQLKSEVVADMVIKWAKKRDILVYYLWQNGKLKNGSDFGIRALLAQFANLILKKPSQDLDERLDAVMENDYKGYLKVLCTILVDMEKQQQILVLVHGMEPKEVADMRVRCGYPSSPAFLFVILRLGPDQEEASGLARLPFYFSNVPFPGD